MHRQQAKSVPKTNVAVCAPNCTRMHRQARHTKTRSTNTIQETGNSSSMVLTVVLATEHGLKQPIHIVECVLDCSANASSNPFSLPLPFMIPRDPECLLFAQYPSDGTTRKSATTSHAFSPRAPTTRRASPPRGLPHP